MSGIEADRQLLDGIRRDDPGAFEEFVRSLRRPKIYGFGMRVCGETRGRQGCRPGHADQGLSAPEGREGAGGAALLAVSGGLERLPDAAPQGQVRAPARELTLEELMPRGREEAEIQIPDAATGFPTTRWPAAEIHQAVHAGIRELPPEYRMVLHAARHRAALDAHEVAVALDLPAKARSKCACTGPA